MQNKTHRQNLRRKIFPAWFPEAKSLALMLSVREPNGYYPGYFVTFLYSLQIVTSNRMLSGFYRLPSTIPMVS